MPEILGPETDFLSSADLSQLPKEQMDMLQSRRRLAPYERSGPGRAEKLDEYTRTYKSHNVFDIRLAVCAMKVEVLLAGNGATSDVLTMSGEVSEPRYAAGFQKILEQLGFVVLENGVQTLPAAGYAGKYAFIAAAPEPTTLRAEPRANAEQVNSLPPGSWVRLLRDARESDLKIPMNRVTQPVSEWVMAQSDEGYIGFAPRAEVQNVCEKIFPPQGMLLQPVELDGTRLAAGSMLMHHSGKWMVAGPKLSTPLPDDAKVVKFGKPDTEENILDVMSVLIGQKYVWGGRTDAGIDCSGLAQWYARTRGVNLPRDAAEQAICGRITAFGSEDVVRNAQPGELVFFANGEGRVSHVGVALGGGKLLHSSTRPGVVIQQLDSQENTDTTSTLASRILYSRRVW